MKRHQMLFAALALTAVASSLHGLASAEPSSSEVVARVGPTAIRVTDVERQLAKLPRFQLGSLGSTPEAIRKTMLERHMIPLYLLAQGALSKGLGDSPLVRMRERDALKMAILRQLREELDKQAPISDQDVAAYYEEHKASYVASARYAIWRIVVNTKEEAAQVLAEAKKDPTPKAWSELARTKSIDKATNMHGGNLGFVTEAGESADAKLKLGENIMGAVKAVKDGEIVDRPLQEGSSWVVVWRRGSMPSVQRSATEEATNIRKILQREKSIAAQEKMIADLKARFLRDYNPNLVDMVEVSASGQVQAPSKPGRIERRAAGSAPVPTPRGTR